MYQLSFFCQETHYLPPRQDSKSLDELLNWARTVSYTGTHTPGERAALASWQQDVKLLSLN